MSSAAAWVLDHILISSNTVEACLNFAEGL